METKIRSFNKTVEKGIEMVKDVMEELGYDDMQKAYAALRGVMHALRDRLSVEEAADFAAQLPLLIKGVFYDGWTPSGKPLKIRTLDEFLDYVRNEIARDDIDPEEAARAVFCVFRMRMTSGEIDDIIGDLPRSFAPLWQG